MGNFTIYNVILFAVLILPGFISMRVFDLLNPSNRRTASDAFFEAISFGLINAFIFSPIWILFGYQFVEAHPVIAYLLTIVALIIAPALWAIALYLVLSWLGNRGIVLERHRTAFDAFFSRRHPCWLVVHLTDGTRVGGRFSTNSFASFYPRSGHLYIEELWELDENGAFKNPITGSQGMLLRPDDYKLIEILKDTEGKIQDGNNG